MPFLPLQIDAIKAASLERQAQLDRETAELKQQQDELTAKLKEFQQRVSSCKATGTQFGCRAVQCCACGLPSATLHSSRSTADVEFTPNSWRCAEKPLHALYRHLKHAHCAIACDLIMPVCGCDCRSLVLRRLSRSARWLWQRCRCVCRVLCSGAHVHPCHNCCLQQQNLHAGQQIVYRPSPTVKLLLQC